MIFTVEAMKSSAWWQHAGLLIDLGINVVVQDPRAVVVQSFWDRDIAHGAIQIMPRMGSGWVVSVYEFEPDEHTEETPMEGTHETPTEW